MTVAELLARVSSAEISEWRAHFRLESMEWEERKTRAELRSEASTGVQKRIRKMRNR
jgi:hypothetical protein